jgi:hypothetical protein
LNPPNAVQNNDLKAFHAPKPLIELAQIVVTNWYSYGMGSMLADGSIIEIIADGHSYEDLA